MTTLTISGPWRSFIANAIDNEFFRISRLLSGVDLQAFIGQTEAFWLDFYTPSVMTESNMQYAIVEHREAPGIDAGTATVGLWTKRPQNNILVDADNIVSINNNEITIGPGLYLIRAWGTAFKINASKLRLYDVTNSSVIALGAVGWSGNGDTTSTILAIDTILTVQSTIAFAVEQYATATFSGRGLGRSANDGSDEIYAQTIITKLG